MVLRSVVVVSSVLLGCHAAGSGQGALPSPRSPAPPPASTPKVAHVDPEEILLASLPASMSFLLGGDFMKLQSIFSDPDLAQPAESIAKGLASYSACFYKRPDLHFLGGFTMDGTTVDMRVAQIGIDVPGVAKCATSAGFKVTVDPDQKFITVEYVSSAGPVKQSLLMRANGVLYAKQSLVTPNAPVSRAELEADADSSARANALGNPQVRTILARVDRSKSAWFAGNAAGTRFANQIGEALGTFDISPDVAITAEIQFLDPALETKIEQALTQAKAGASAIPSPGREIVESMQFHTAGERIHISVAVTAAQMKTLLNKRRAGSATP